MHRPRTRQPLSLWSDLPSELLSLIFVKLTGELDHLLSCASVCVWWRSVMGLLNGQLKRSKPFLILIDKPIVEEEPPSQQHLHIMDALRDKSHVIRLPQLSKQWFHSCSNGWLFTISSEFPHETRFLNPITRSEIKLPSLALRFERRFRVITSSSTPWDPNCVVLGCHLDPDHSMQEVLGTGNHMVLCHPQDQTWTKVIFDRDGILWHDIILYKNEFYAVSHQLLYRISFDGNVDKLISLPSTPQQASGFLVEMDGDMILVLKTKTKSGQGICFKLFKLKFDDDGHKIWWIRIRDLGGSAIYLGKACSVSVSDQQHKNCVFFFVGTDLHRLHLKSGHLRRNFYYKIPPSTSATQWFTHYE